ncbi:MAG: STAS domain-containing protein [Erysipelotrichaceae bacterium]|nr:STAS domain-containing protein [Erysipelotrichaceae bacterium]
MIIEKQVTDSAMTIKVIGRLDSVTSPQLEEVTSKELEGITDLTFDFSELEYISSAGLRVILISQKTMNNQGKMRVTGINQEVRDIFEVTGFVDIIDVE